MLTPQQLRLLKFIDKYIKDHEGVSPSYEEMRIGLGLGSKAGINRLLNALEERGFVFRLKHRERAIEVLQMPGEPMAPTKQLDIPFVKSIYDITRN